MVGLLGLLAMSTSYKKGQEIEALRAQLEAQSQHNELADLQRELQLLQEQNEMLTEQLVEEQLKNSISSLSDSDSSVEKSVTHSEQEIQEAVLSALHGQRLAAGSLRERLKGAYPGITKHDVNSALYKLQTKGKTRIVEERGSKKIWAA
jgi:DNA-binding transcriptional MerR regulator